MEARGNLLQKGHPLEDHEELCPGVLAKTKILRDEFDPNTLLLNRV